MDKIGRFEIVGKLGRGAFGMVYKGRDPVINRLAAIKVMSEATVGDPELVARFRREAEAAGGLNHRNIVTIYDLGEHDGLPYIAMEFLEGNDLEQMLKEKTEVPIDRKIEIMIQVAEGLEYAHGCGVVHRDIKPANIRLVRDGTVKIMDFGIAKMSSSDMTRTGQFMGTVNYMSPEQIKAKRLDGRSDLFAAGVMFYEMLSYRRPFPGDSITAVIYKIVNENPTALKELKGTRYEWLEGIIFKCLEKDPQRRWASCREFADALRAQRLVEVRTAPAPLDKTLDMAQATALEGDVDSALESLDRVLENDPDNQAVLSQKRQIQSSQALREAESMISSGRLEQARDHILRAHTAWGPSDELNNALGTVDERLKSARASSMLDSAERNIEARRFEAAIEQLKGALELDPYNERVKATLARAHEEKQVADVRDILVEAKGHLQRGQYDEARAGANRALEIDPQSRLAKSVLQRIELDQQESATSSAVDEVLYEASLALRQDNFEEAIEYAEQALKLDPKNDEARELIAESKEAKLAADSRNIVLKLVTNGQKLLRAERFGEAKVQFQKALKLDPYWEEAELGVEAADARRTSLYRPPKKKLGIAKIALALGAIIGLIVAGRALLPSDASKALKLGQAELQAGNLDAAFDAFRAAGEAEGTDLEREQAIASFAALDQQFELENRFDRSKAVVDQLATWRGLDDALRGRYLALADEMGDRGIEAGDASLLTSATTAYRDYFSAGYDGANLGEFEALNRFFKAGEALLAFASRTDIALEDRIAHYKTVQEVMTFVDTKESGLGAFKLATDARLQRTELFEQNKKLSDFNSRLRVVRKRAEEAVAAGNIQAAIDAHNEIIALADESADLAGYVQLDAERETSVQAIAGLAEQQVAAAQDASVETVRAQAKRYQADGNIEAELRQWQMVLDKAPVDVEASRRSRELQSVTKALARLDEEVLTAIQAGREQLAQEKLAEIERLNPKSPRLKVLRANLEGLLGKKQEETRVTMLLQEGEAAFLDGDLEAAEAKYREVLASSSRKDLVDRANEKMQAVLDQRNEARIQELLAQADGLTADPREALKRLREAERLNRNYPGLADRISAANRELNRKAIGKEEDALEAGFEAFEASRGLAAYREARSNLLKLDARSTLVSDLNVRITELLEERLRTVFKQPTSSSADIEKAKSELLSFDPRNRLPQQLEREGETDKLERLTARARAAVARGDLADAEAILAGFPAGAAVVGELRTEIARLRTASAIADARTLLGRGELERTRELLDGVPSGIAEADALRAELAINLQKRSDAQAALSAAQTALGRRFKEPCLAEVQRAKLLWPPLAAEAEAISAQCEKLVSPLRAAKQLATGRRWASASAKLSEHLKQGGTLTASEQAIAGQVFFNTSYLMACKKRPCDLAAAKRLGDLAANYDDPGARVSNSRWADSIGKFSSCEDGQLVALCQAVSVK